MFNSLVDKTVLPQLSAFVTRNSFFFFLYVILLRPTPGKLLSKKQFSPIHVYQAGIKSFRSINILCFDFFLFIHFVHRQNPPCDQHLVTRLMFSHALPHKIFRDSDETTSLKSSTHCESIKYQKHNRLYTDVHVYSDVDTDV